MEMRGVIVLTLPPHQGILTMKSLSKARTIESRVAGINAKKAAGLDRVRQLLRALPPEVSAKLIQSEMKNGVALMSKTAKAVIQSPSDGMYSRNGSSAVTGSVILDKIVGFANG
jgi:hypothetical protein